MPGSALARPSRTFCSVVVLIRSVLSVRTRTGPGSELRPGSDPSTGLKGWDVTRMPTGTEQLTEPHSELRTRPVLLMNPVGEKL